MNFLLSPDLLSAPRHRETRGGGETLAIKGRNTRETNKKASKRGEPSNITRSGRKTDEGKRKTQKT